MGIDKGNNKPRFISNGINPVAKNNATKNSKADGEAKTPKEPVEKKKFISDVKNYFAYSRKASGQNRVTYDLDSLNDV